MWLLLLLLLLIGGWLLTLGLLPRRLLRLGRRGLLWLGRRGLLRLLPALRLGLLPAFALGGYQARFGEATPKPALRAGAGGRVAGDSQAKQQGGSGGDDGSHPTSHT